MESSEKEIKRKKRTLSVIIISLFFLWGMANNMTDTLLYTFKSVLNMSNLQTFFIKFASYGAYFCFSLPAFFFIRKHGYKNSIILGLLMYAGGAVLFFPAANLMNYTLYLIAFYIMAGGCSVLETVANPYIMAMESDADKGIRKLNLAQSFNPLGSIFGIIICNIFVMESDTFGFNNNAEIIKEELDTITIVYAAIGQILLIYMMILLFMNVPSYGLTSKDKILFSKSMNRLLNNKSFILGLITMFLYLGAQVGVWSFTTSALKATSNITDESASKWYIAVIAAFMIGRFFFTFLMKYYNHRILLLIAALGALLGTAIVMFAQGIAVLIAIIFISFFMSLMFSTIFGNAIAETFQDRQLASALLIMAILGGAVITTMQGFVVEKFDIQTSYVIPALCFFSVTFYAVYLIMKAQNKYENLT